MYKTIEGIYEDGKITLEETPELKRSKVMVTLTPIYLSIPPCLLADRFTK